MNTIYLDNNATTKTDEEVVKAMMPYLLDNYGNPSSIYKLGRENRKVVEDSREKIAEILNCKPDEIYFTSGGSESDNTAIRGIAYSYKNKGNHIITSKIEHPAVLETCKLLEKEGFEVSYIGVGENGIINLEELKNAIRPTTTLITIMFANNEIGTIEPIEEIGKIARKHNIYFHTDAVQAMGNLKIDVQRMNIDALSMSAHKFYGPKGVGALYVREGIEFDKQQEGGHQERDKRAGTENVAGIVGLGKAIELAYENIDEYNKKLLNLREYYINQVEENISNIRINGHRTNRLPGNANISFLNMDGEEILFDLDEAGICGSAGSACNSGSGEPSHVLTAIGLPKEAAGTALRITFGEQNTKEDVDYLVNTLINMENKYKNFTN